MKLIVLGSGVAISGANRAASGFVLELKGKAIVVDLGFGAFKNLQSSGIDYAKVNDLFFTHFEHPDHITDLISFLMARKGLVELKMQLPTQINLYAGKGFKEFIKNLFNAFPFFKELPFKLSVTELDSFATKKFPDFTLTTKPMKHVESSLGYRFEAEKKAVVFSGDTVVNENLVELAKEADLVVADCSHFGRGPGHMNVEQAATTTQRANAKALLLTHFYLDAEKEDVKKEAKKYFQGKIYSARDLMKVNI